MPSTFDLSDATPPPPGEPHRHNINPSSPPPGQPGGGGRDLGPGPGYTGRGTGTALDEYAALVLKIALAAGVLLLGYLLYGLFSGEWAHTAFRAMSPETQQRQFSNINLCAQGLQVVSWVIVITMLICGFRDESIGYILVAAGALFYAGFPFLTNHIYGLQEQSPSHASTLALSKLQSLAGIYAFPGIIWLIGDFVRRLRSYSENAAIQRVNMKYGANVAKQPTSQYRNTFLGRCWELPYCRENVRQRCPIFLKRRGPCWWYKQGCMCEEKIILQAVLNPDWKEQTAQVAQRQQAGLTAANRSDISPAAKRERCRKCVIYNEHQRQKYKLLSSAAMLVVMIGFAIRWDAIQNWVTLLVTAATQISDRFSFTNTSAIGQAHSIPVGVLWLVIGAIGLTLASLIIKGIEYCCFKLKI